MVSSSAIAPVLLLLQETAPTAQFERKHDVSALLPAVPPHVLKFDLAPAATAAPAGLLHGHYLAIAPIDLIELPTRLLKSGGTIEAFKLDTEDEDEAALRGPDDLELRLLALDGDAPLPFVRSASHRERSREPPHLAPESGQARRSAHSGRRRGRCAAALHRRNA